MLTKSLLPVQLTLVQNNLLSYFNDKIYRRIYAMPCLGLQSGGNIHNFPVLFNLENDVAGDVVQVDNLSADVDILQSSSNQSLEIGRGGPPPS